MGTFRDRGEQVGPPEQANHSVSDWKVTCARPVTLVVRPFNRRIAVESTPIREIKPVVVPAQYFVWGPLMAGFISIFPGFFTFIISNIIGMGAGDPFERIDRGPVVVYGVVVFILSFVACMALLWVKFFQEPGRTTYAIFPDRVEYDEGLWNRHRRTVVFGQVIDVELTEGVLQQTQGAGTVTLVTQQLVSGQDGKLSNHQIALQNVPQPREVYELVRSLALKKGGA
jgi:membrane protein YdbS with pleckstrin-like domain